MANIAWNPKPRCLSCKVGMIVSTLLASEEDEIRACMQNIWGQNLKYIYVWHIKW